MNVLLENKLVTDIEKELILKAQRCDSSERISFGRTLKRALLHYKEKGDVSNEIDGILKKVDVGIDELVERFLYTKTIKTVQDGE